MKAFSFIFIFILFGSNVFGQITSGYHYIIDKAKNLDIYFRPPKSQSKVTLMVCSLATKEYRTSCTVVPQLGLAVIEVAPKNEPTVLLYAKLGVSAVAFEQWLSE